jgi:hypothetical protein
VPNVTRVGLRFIGGLQRHEHLIALDPNLQARLSDRWAELVLSIADIELPSMPRARDDRTAESSFAQGAALVWANTIESVKSAVDIEQCYDTPCDNDFAGTTGWAIFEPRNRHKSAHRLKHSVKEEADTR